MGLIIYGDLHLDDRVYASMPGMTGDSRYALRQIAEAARTRQADVIDAGDSFDVNYPTADLVKLLLDEFRDLRVGFLVGQHGRQARRQWLELGNNFQPLDRRLTELGGFKVYGLDWRPRGEYESAIREVPQEAELLIAHLLLRQCLDIDTGDPQRRTWDADAEWFPETIKHTFLADWHGLPNEGVTAGRSWAYTGSMCLRSVNEPPEKSFIHCWKAVGGGVVWERVALRTRPLYSATLLNAATFEEECAALVQRATALREEALAGGTPEEVASPLLIGCYAATIPAGYARLTRVLAPLLENRQVHLRMRPLPLREEKELVVDDSAELSLEAILKQLVDPDLSPELHRLVADLCSAEDPRAVVAAFKSDRAIEPDLKTR